MRVLMVENDLDVGQKLFCALKSADYNVDWVRDGKSGSTAIASAYYAFVLLNPGVAGVCGMDLLRSSRAAGSRVPVLLLTERDDPDTRVRGLDIGADDCLLKPIDIRELLARIRAVLRRAAGYATSRIGDEALSLDLHNRTICRNGAVSALSAREFALMHAFIERRGSILSRGQLEERIYGWGREVESNAIDVLIHAMRKRFGRNLIRNVRGMGWTVPRDESSSDERRSAQWVARKTSRETGDALAY
ncbi:response regulator transcription factor [Burkholderia sp. Ac-20365]|uniref:response regulator transcription factor n=1 Tax=Burkholderia sp. Ac-20365 TaxID=2703897 RepID=UPI00197BE203|nr:response regulator transcription factor [Burkholderia sp. Ac-20365]MBN3764179.1 response regulator transcription factor [Burkholderia sp. Ac-20365]